MTAPTGPGLAPRAAAPAPAKSDSNTGEQKKGRGRRPGSQPKVRPDIPQDLFKIVKVPESERGKFKRAREPRSDKQIAVDALVMQTFQEWKDAGRPVAWGRMPVQDWPLPPNLVETATFWLGKAAQLHGLKMVYGQKGVVDEIDGVKTYHLTFCVVERKTKVTGVPEDKKE